MRWIPLVLVLVLSCGGGDSWKDIGGRCATPRSGVDPITGQRYPDQKGSLDDEKTWRDPSRATRKSWIELDVAGGIGLF